MASTSRDQEDTPPPRMAKPEPTGLGRGRTTILYLSLSLVLLLAAIAFESRETLRAWFSFWRDFESLGTNAQGYREYQHRQTGIVFVKLPGGSYQMGKSSQEVEQGGFDSSHEYSNEPPAHKVTLSPFLIAKYELTQGQWRAIMKANPSANQGKNLPVEQVSWLDCREFCRKTGLSLPTEAQWEYACRAGSTGQYSGTGRLDDMGWYVANSGGRSQPVGQKKPNDFGLHDMHGNVWEWCEDRYDPDFYAESGRTRDPVCMGQGRNVVRGGSWDEDDWYCRCSLRSHMGGGSKEIGIRLARSMP